MPHPLPKSPLALLILLTLTPTLPADTAPDNSIYTGTLHLLSEGKQADAERVLAEAVKTFDTDARLTFFSAACTRSRFDVAGALPLFRRVLDLDRNGPYGQVAARIILIDLKHDDPERRFAELAELVAKYPDEPLFAWMAAVQCRSLGKTAQGIAYFASLSTVFNPGPSLYNQTYANLLDNAKRYHDALTHRLLAVRLEPATWSYDGLGNTLTSLRMWQDADEAYAKAISLAPTRTHSYANWARSLRLRAEWTAVVDKCVAGLAVDPRDVTLWNEYADAEVHLGHDDSALRCYNHAIELAPNAYYAYERASILFARTGQAEQARVFRTRAALLRPKNADQTAATDTR